MRRVLKTAIRNNADPKKFPFSYLIPKREKGEKCPKGKTKIKQIKISGRSTYFCPKRQKL